MPEPTADRLTRLLALVAYLRDHPGVPVPDVARHFGVSEAQVLADVNLLWVSGTPGYLPDDLLDFSADALDHGVLTLTQARGMDRPLRLSPSEAMSLLVALRSLAALADGDPALDADALRSATAKLQDAAGQAATQATAVHVDAPAAAPAALPTLRHALAEGRQVHLRYVSAADVVTERDVDPVELRADGERWTLRAWCHRAQDARTFRVDRVLAAQVLPTPAAAHPEVADAEPDWAEGQPVTLRLASRARWVAEHTPVESVTDLPDGSLEVRLRVADPAWVTNLVLSLGEAVLAVRPAGLARAAAARARQALAAYDHLA
ncbi:WYL domain-containing protein [Georgenia sp. TF02-10]|uniref:helix-turn-helix transcriptional regulator n=1 Tax=Georgenia sp. TF02-10 TaxID=2917725 RepID=UPI001FA6D522|nr:WYL domain-containing protein [Georgenia sp. TF02-10]UNX53196.1 WYL domain-containing protein [Georgenia sp. TF02-10]